MAITVDSLDILRNYLTKLMDRANHHADGVNEIVLALIGGVIWRSTDEVTVKQYAGDLANILWMVVNGKRYCFAYNHDNDEIEIREENLKGKILHVFSNATPISNVKMIFESL